MEAIFSVHVVLASTTKPLTETVNYWLMLWTSPMDLGRYHITSCLGCWGAHHIHGRAFVTVAVTKIITVLSGEYIDCSEF